MKKFIALIALAVVLIPAISFAGFCGYLKADTAVTLKIGPFIDSTDGNTAETALTISQADVRLTKNGGDFAQKNDANAATHDELGYYNCQIDTTDTNTEGRLKVVVHESGALLVEQTYQVVNANVFDSLYAVATTDYLQVDVVSISGSTDASDNLEASAETIVTAAAAAGTLSTTQMTTTLTEVTDDHYNGRIIIWTSGVLKDQATDITDYDGTTKMVTYTATTEAPGDGDTFNII